MWGRQSSRFTARCVADGSSVNENTREQRRGWVPCIAEHRFRDWFQSILTRRWAISCKGAAECGVCFLQVPKNELHWPHNPLGSPCLQVFRCPWIFTRCDCVSASLCLQPDWADGWLRCTICGVGSGAVGVGKTFRPILGFRCYQSSQQNRRVSHLSALPELQFAVGIGANVCQLAMANGSPPEFATVCNVHFSGLEVPLALSTIPLGVVLVGVCKMKVAHECGQEGVVSGGQDPSPPVLWHPGRRLLWMLMCWGYTS
mmetsp:Transcript_16676/g.29799  ORF Transcript_16676/g.29799 Transcript_16676/m.29799 type:complete len:258 (-) Transcript_16676:304-1077(-)